MQKLILEVKLFYAQIADLTSSQAFAGLLVTFGNLICSGISSFIIYRALSVTGKSVFVSGLGLDELYFRIGVLLFSLFSAIWLYSIITAFSFNKEPKTVWIIEPNGNKKQKAIDLKKDYATIIIVALVLEIVAAFALPNSDKNAKGAIFMAVGVQMVFLFFGHKATVLFHALSVEDIYRKGTQGIQESLFEKNMGEQKAKLGLVEKGKQGGNQNGSKQNPPQTAQQSLHKTPNLVPRNNGTGAIEIPNFDNLIKKI